MRRNVDKVLYLSENQASAEQQNEAKRLAQSLLDRMAEAKDIQLTENADRNRRIPGEWCPHWHGWKPGGAG